MLVGRGESAALEGNVGFDVNITRCRPRNCPQAHSRLSPGWITQDYDVAHPSRRVEEL